MLVEVPRVYLQYATFSVIQNYMLIPAGHCSGPYPMSFQWKTLHYNCAVDVITDVASKFLNFFRQSRH